MLTFSNEKPEIYETLKEKFKVDWDKGLIITVGNVVHSKNPISRDLIIHEGTHVVQQTEMGVKDWWDKYLEDPEFRLSQELEAYRNQLIYIRSLPFSVMSKRDKMMMEMHIVKSLKTMYGLSYSSKQLNDMLF